LSASGAPMWATDGVLVGSAPDASAGYSSHHVVTDLAGGAIVVWDDYRGGINQVFAQHLDASGARLWNPDANLVASGTTSSGVSDGAGGAVVAWQSNGDIFVQRLDAAETPQWGVSGVQLSATTQFDGAPGLAADGTGGTFVVWQSVSGPSSIDLLGQ